MELLGGLVINMCFFTLREGGGGEGGFVVAVGGGKGGGEKGGMQAPVVDVEDEFEEACDVLYKGEG